jgi:uncharacterized protein
MNLIEKTCNFVRDELISEGIAHDWWHVYRVWKLAKRIGADEKANMLIVELAALLHDIADWKSQAGNRETGPTIARDWLTSQGADKAVADSVYTIIRDMPFQGANVAEANLSLEGEIVRDADRLDAMGAIGIARTFAYGGSKGRLIYDPQTAPIDHATPESYLNTQNHTLNHFYEKLLLLKDRMRTKTGKAIAQERHNYMEDYVRQFLSEWQGQD